MGWSDKQIYSVKRCKSNTEESLIQEIRQPSVQKMQEFCKRRVAISELGQKKRQSQMLDCRKCKQNYRIESTKTKENIRQRRKKIKFTVKNERMAKENAKKPPNKYVFFSIKHLRTSKTFNPHKKQMIEIRHN